MGLNIICVGIGGCIGAILRYLISLNSAKLFGASFPFGTLIVNVLGGFLIGAIMEFSDARDMSPLLRTFLTTGIMGGLTTFSTFSLETINLFSSSNYMLGGLNIILNVSLSLIGVFLGRVLIRTIFI
ncbi:fluoride efflux transporter CrcB [Clostridium cylindrosporum]|uniref:Fluoride-specific ion channel FluC n=1 Tax=Clostridium cylindrosporum DSM 605 TaxID=1121307 RepID=A0A0J8G2B7_CLOCY|nr:fluoride efflux transporter CrcB [Clostridium cylindrosporum]KMT21881.1 putative fluoride ion transporter CrcB [Clostridium cylindrosporum DSM 605]